MFHYIYTAVFFSRDDEFQAIIPDLNLTTAGLSLDEAYILIKDYLRVYCTYAVKFDIEIEFPTAYNIIKEKYKDDENAIVMLIDASVPKK